MLRKHFHVRARMKARRGQSLVEYIIIVASVAMISLIAVSMFGHKVADQYAIGAGMLPGAHADDNLPITTGGFAGFTTAGDVITGNGEVTWASITGNIVPGEMENNVAYSTDNNAAKAFVAE